MEMHQIRYFLALCEELSFTRAAQRCAIAQSSLTRAIKALETELGGALFHRERANTRLWLKGLLYTATVFTILLGTLVIFTFDPNIR